MPFLHCHISGSGEAAFLPLKWGWKFGTDRIQSEPCCIEFLFPFQLNLL